MEFTTYQNFERRNAQDQIIRPGTWGKNTALVNGQNTGILDYIANNLDWLKINKAEAADLEALQGDVAELQSDVETLQGDVTSLQSDVTALDEGKVDVEDFNAALADKVDKSTTVNGHALSGNVTVTKSDVGLGSVDNVKQFPMNTSGSAGKALIGGNDNNAKFATTATYIKRSTAYSVGDRVYSEKLGAGEFLVCTQAGTTGSTEPDWS